MYYDALHICDCYFCFFFKQKTAYELRISDWSSDVCSSDLPGLARVSQTMVGVTEANLTTGQESREERIGNTVERPPGLREAQPEDKLDAACRPIRPALRVATGTTLAAPKPPDRQRGV